MNNDEPSRQGQGRPEKRSQRATLKLLGVTKSESSRWQQVAAVPPDVRKRYVQEVEATRGEVTTAGLLRFWRRLQDQEPPAARPRPQTWTAPGDPVALGAALRERYSAEEREQILASLTGQW